MKNKWITKKKKEKKKTIGIFNYKIQPLCMEKQN